MKNKLIILLILPFFIVSCFNKRINNPESVDLIYLDIQKDIKKLNKVIKLRESEIQTVRGEMNSLPTRSKGIVIKQMRITNMEDDIVRFKQLKKYMLIKQRKRKQMAKIRYELRLKDKLEWPDKEEFRKYLIVKNHNQMPVEEINKSDNSRSPTHKKDVGEILRSNGL